MSSKKISKFCGIIPITSPFLRVEILGRQNVLFPSVICFTLYKFSK